MIWIKRKDPSCVEIVCHDHNLLDLIETRLKGMYNG